MKLPSIASPLATTITTTTTPLNPALRPKALNLDAFSIAGFQAYTLPHSSLSYTIFTMKPTPTSPAAHCLAESAECYHCVANFSVTTCNTTEQPAPPTTINFNLTRTADWGAEVNFFWDVIEGVMIRGTHVIPGDIFVREGEGTSVTESYVGPEAFEVGNLSLVVTVGAPS